MDISVSVFQVQLSIGTIKNVVRPIRKWGIQMWRLVQYGDLQNQKYLLFKLRQDRNIIATAI